MSGDYSRQRFDPRKHYTAVLMQQGRVQLDADWNELVELFERRFRAERVDTLGRAVVPRNAPDGFRISLAGGDLRIGRGRIYVDGLLAENHGAPGVALYDPILGELRGGPELRYADQPYFPGAAELAAPPNGPYLAYLDVWQREVTALEDPALLEPALGVDTTTRLQVAWQVRCLPLDPNDLPRRDTPDDDATRLPGWRELIAPTGARLTTATGAPVPDGADPCLLPPGGGYRSLDNQLYRLELHDGGVQAQGGPTVRWSRDNGSVVARVLRVRPDRLVLTVSDIGRDDVLRFRDGDWVEFTHDRLEAQGKPGVMAKIRAVDDDARLVTLHTPVPEALAPDVLAGLHARLRRWDHNGEVFDDKNQRLVDLSRPDSGGVIPVPKDARFVVLERGIKVSLQTAPGESPRFRTGDYWTFAARSADASVERLEQAAPRGHVHHFARLAVVDPAKSTATDVRTLWPPADDGGDDCVFVSADQHNAGVRTIQEALDSVRDGGGTVCLGPGVYRITRDALRIVRGRGVKLRGAGARTVLLRQTLAPFRAVQLPLDNNPQPKPPAVEYDDGAVADPTARSLLRVEDTVGFALSDLVLVGSAASALGEPLVAVRNVAGLDLERLFIVHTGHGKGFTPALRLAGALLGATLRDSVILSKVGLAAGDRLFSADLRIENNTFSCQRRGIELAGLVVHAQTTRIAGNSFAGCLGFGVRLEGVVHPGRTVEVADNVFDTINVPLVSHATHTTLTGNVARGVFGRGAASPASLAAEDDDDIPPAEQQNLDGFTVHQNPHTPISEGAVIRGNTLRGFVIGLNVSAPVRRVTIADNVVTECRRFGIYVTAPAHFGQMAVVDVRGNQVTDINDDQRLHAVGVGISINGGGDVDIADNTVARVFATQDPRPSLSYVRGIEANQCVNPTIRDNTLRDIGPSAPVTGQPETAVIVLVHVFGRAQVANNRHAHTSTAIPAAQIFGLLIGNWPNEWYVMRDQIQPIAVTETRITPFNPTNRLLQITGNQIHGSYGRNHNNGSGASDVFHIFSQGGQVVLMNNVFTFDGVPLNPIVGQPAARWGHISAKFPAGNLVVQGNYFHRTSASNTPPELHLDGTNVYVFNNFLYGGRLFVNGALQGSGTNNNVFF